MQKSILASLLFLSVLSANAKEAALDCTDPSTQPDMNACAYEAYNKAKAEHNLAYKKADSLADKKIDYLPGQHRMKDIETAWLKYRDLQCQFEADRYEGGSIQPMVETNCLTSLTIERTKVLELMIEDLDR